MDPKRIDIAKKIIRILYNVDRELYSTLVFEIGYDPMKSLQIIAFWIWLEQTGFNNVMRTFLSLPTNLISGLAEDAMTCLECVKHAQFLLSPAAREIVLTQRVVGKGLSLHYLHENRGQAMCGVGKIFDEIYVKALTDIVAMPPKINTEQQSQKETMLPPITELSLIKKLGQLGLGGQSSRGNEVPVENRTMLVTFSRGFLVAEWEINEVMTRMFGNCIESIQMQNPMPYGQPLYAHVVFFSPATIDSILHGNQVAKLTVNGKDMWITKFAPANTSHPPAF